MGNFHMWDEGFLPGPRPIDDTKGSNKVKQVRKASQTKARKYFCRHKKIHISQFVKKANGSRTKAKSKSSATSSRKRTRAKYVKSSS